MRLTKNLENMAPDPIRHWITVCKELGAEHMFTIGVPDPIPKSVLRLYARAAYGEDLSGKTSYPPVDGELVLREGIVRMEKNFGVNYVEDDVKRIYPTVGASQALQFAFSLFEAGSEIMTMTPCWGTIHNMIAHSGGRSVPVELFSGGRFIEENAKAALTDKTQGVYINFPSNPAGIVVPEKTIREFASWAVSNRLQIISDEPYKYLIYRPEKTPYFSPLNAGGEAYDNTIVVSSFSKIIKPDIRLGFIRMSPKIVGDSGAGNLKHYFRNLSAGASRAVQVGVSAVIEKDPKLGFLKKVAAGYRRKVDLMVGYLGKLGCSVPEKPMAGYMLFAKTPDDADGEEFVRKMASEHKIGFVPGSSFGGNFSGFEYLRKYFRAGIGGGLSVEKIKEIMEGALK